MEEKKEIKIRLSTVIYLLIIVALVVTLGVTYYFGFVANKNEQEQKNEDKISNIQKLEESNEINNEIKDKDNTIKENETVSINKRDKAIEEIKEALKDEKWIKENLYLNENRFGEKISENAKQNITFEVIQSEEEAPIIIVQAEVEDEYSIQLSIIRYKNNEVNVKNWDVQNSSRSGYQIKDNILISSWAAMGDWTYDVYEIDESSEEKIETDEGSIGEDEDDEGYVELEKVIDKYSAKPISKKLNNSNIEKYIK